MFTEQAAQAMGRLVQLLGEDSAVEILQLLGNCAQPLSHRGTLTLESSSPNAPQIQVWDPLDSPPPSGDLPYGVFIDNRTSAPAQTDPIQQVNGGFSLVAYGVSYIQYLLAGDIMLPGFCWEDVEVIKPDTLKIEGCKLIYDTFTIRVLKDCRPQPSPPIIQSDPPSPPDDYPDGSNPSQPQQYPGEDTMQYAANFYANDSDGLT